MELRNSRGRAVLVGPKFDGGGEGTIHRVAPGIVAKLYLEPVSAAKAAKLRAMPGMAAPENVAWPRDVLLRGEKIVGFTMPEITGHAEFHNVSNNLGRRAKFPTADYRFLVAVAENLARAVASVHAAEHVIGDINDRVALVHPHATVWLVDADSFQVPDGETLHFCDGGMPNFQPPELQAAGSFVGLRRTRNHDCFGLAVLIFQTLFLGRHPFAGRPVSGEAMAIPEAIRGLHFAWDETRAGVGLTRPSSTLPLATVTPEIAGYFRRAFGPVGAEQGRPSAAAWVQRLEELQAALVTCKANPAHAHLPGTCGLCEIEAGLGRPIFGERPAAARTGSAPASPVPAEWARLWRGIAMVPPPPARGKAPEHHSRFVVGRPYPEVGRLARLLGRVLGPTAAQAERARREAAVAAAEAEVAQLEAAWAAHDPAARFRAERARLEVIFRDLQKSSGSMGEAIAQASRRRALGEYLEGFAIAESRVSGIGAVSRRTLVDHGVETAADVTQAALEVLPNFGPERVAAMLDWRRTLERMFVPPAVLPPPHAGDLAAITKGRDAWMLPSVNALTAGVALLQGIVTAEAERTRRETEALLAARLALAQARADLAVAVPG